MFSAMPQLTDFQRQVIVLFKTEHPTWGLGRCAEVLPQFFEGITKNQFTLVASRVKEGTDASKRKYGSGGVPKFDASLKESVCSLAVTPEGSPNKRHLSQREIATHLQMSKGAVYTKY